MSTMEGSCPIGAAQSQHMARAANSGLITLFAVCALVSCASTPTVTSVGKSVATLEKFDGVAGCTNAPAPNPQAWWSAMPPANRQYPFAGWETFRNVTGGCANTRVDQYRAVATFNLASVANLRGLVQKAELVVSTRALPANTGDAPAVGPLGQPGSINLFCPRVLGGAGSLVRFGPNAAVPTTSPTGSLTMLGSDPFPSGTNIVYTLPAQYAGGPIANASNPTTLSQTGDQRAVMVSDVTGSVTAALNAGAASMSWMLTSNFEGPLPGQLAAAGTVDCKTSYDFDLRITHL
jgi:hypothetical protein